MCICVVVMCVLEKKKIKKERNGKVRKSKRDRGKK